MKKSDGTQHAEKETRASIINTVQTPLGFFVLVVLIVEVVLTYLAGTSSGSDRTYIILGMLALMFLLVLTVAVMALFRHESLFGPAKPTEPDNRDRSEERDLANKVHSLGIADIAADWTQYTEFSKSTFNVHFKKRFDEDKTPATWYIVTHSPHAFLGWQDIFEDAVERRGIIVKWVYHAVESVGTDKALKAQREWLSASTPNWQDRAAPGKGLQRLAGNISTVKQWAIDADARIQVSL